MDSGLPQNDAVPRERTGCPSAEQSRTSMIGASQQEPVERIVQDEIQMQMVRLKNFVVRLQISSPEVIRVTQARHALWTSFARRAR